MYVCMHDNHKRVVYVITKQFLYTVLSFLISLLFYFLSFSSLLFFSLLSSSKVKMVNAQL